MRSPITFAKIVATPTVSSWSQAYNAGNLAAVISLTQSPIENGEEGFEGSLSLPSTGKELLNTLEAEYFTLESKNLETIKQAILTTCERLTGPITLTLSVAVIIENILYVFLYGKGKVIMKRSGKLGTILEQKEDAEIISGSGFIENGDIVILETPQFEAIVPQHILLPCLEHDKLSEMAEILSPVIHKEQEGAAAALAFSYQEEQKIPATQPSEVQKKDQLVSDDFVLAPTLSEENDEQNDQEEEEETEEETKKPSFFSPKQKSQSQGVSHSRRLLLTIAVILAVVLVASIYFAIKKQQDNARQAMFQQSIVPAQKKYDEGQSLMDLNKSLARDDFQSAKHMLEPVVSKLPADSKEAQQGKALLAKIDDALNNTAQATTVNATPVDASVSPILSALSKNPTALYAATDGTNTYIADNTGISSIKNSTAVSVVKNSSDWQSIGGFGAYLGNFYLLDKKDGIIKYAGGKAPKSSYLAKGVAPDFSSAVDLSIDGSIWVLSSNGDIEKFTKGTQDAFTIKGLDKPFVKPTRIFTSADDTNVYILDNGNNRLVVMDKNGNFTAQYQTNLIGKATALDVHESDKKAYILSSGKVYEIDLK